MSKKPKTVLNEILPEEVEPKVEDTVEEAVEEAVEEPKEEPKEEIVEVNAAVDLTAILNVIADYKRQGYKVVWCGEDAPKAVKDLAHPFDENETESLLVLATDGFEKIQEKLNKCKMDHYHLMQFSGTDYKITFIKL